MNQLLAKLRVRAVNTSNTLLTVIKNPVEQHLPVDCPKIGVSQDQRGKPVKIWDYVPTMAKNETTVYFIDLSTANEKFSTNKTLNSDPKSHTQEPEAEKPEEEDLIDGWRKKEYQETDMEKCYDDLVRFFAKKVQPEMIVSRLLLEYENLQKLI